MAYNPHTWVGLDLARSKDQKLFMLQLVDTVSRLNTSTGAGTGSGGSGGYMLTSVYDTNNNGVVDTCDSLAWSKLTGTPNIAPGALNQLSISNLAITANQTIDCTGYAVVWINYTLTAAINLVTTLNNLASGAFVYWRVRNGSGATQSLTLRANSPPTVNAYSVIANVWAGVAPWSSGVLVNNNAYGSIFGITANVGGVWNLFGNGVNG